MMTSKDTREAREALKGKGLNLNSILLFIILGVGSWVGTETRSNALAVAEMRATMRRVEDQMAGSVTRREFDVRVIGLEARQAELSARLRDVEVTNKKR